MLQILMACLPPLVTLGVRTALQGADDLHLLDESCDSHNLFHQCRQLTPHVLLLRLNLLEDNFEEWMAQLRTACPTTKILLLLDPGQEEALEIQKLMQVGGVAQSYLMNQLICYSMRYEQWGTAGFGLVNRFCTSLCSQAHLNLQRPSRVV